jgi:hypothetical protein
MAYRTFVGNGVALEGGRRTAVSDTDPQDMSEALQEQVAAERELSERLRQHAGEWVAVRNHKVVAHAPTLEELMENVRDTNQEEEVEVFEVSIEPDSVYFF